MSKLSPQAQAVANAARAAYWQKETDIAAAALRAAADQVVPEFPEPMGYEDARAWFALMDVRRDFLAIAAELEQ